MHWSHEAVGANRTSVATATVFFLLFVFLAVIAREGANGHWNLSPPSLVSSPSSYPTNLSPLLQTILTIDEAQALLSFSSVPSNGFSITPLPEDDSAGSVPQQYGAAPLPASAPVFEFKAESFP
ncbi:hypothetical protein CRG98_031888, partial [Punica granatum]